jgi:hypothetical protein
MYLVFPGKLLSKKQLGVCDVCANSHKKIKEKKPKTVVSTSSYITKSSPFDTLK